MFTIHTNKQSSTIAYFPQLSLSCLKRMQYRNVILQYYIVTDISTEIRFVTTYTERSKYKELKYVLRFLKVNPVTLKMTLQKKKKNCGVTAAVCAI